MDRLLKAILGAVLFQHILALESSLDPNTLEKLIDPERHPIGQWMELARLAKGLDYDWQLTATPGFASAEEGTVQDGRLRKWRSGQDLLSFVKARKMIQGAEKEGQLKQALLAARTLAMVIDVVQSTAAGRDYPSRQHAQELVARRFKQLRENLWLSLSAIQKQGGTGIANSLA